MLYIFTGLKQPMATVERLILIVCSLIFLLLHMTKKLRMKKKIDGCLNYIVKMPYFKASYKIFSSLKENSLILFITCV